MLPLGALANRKPTSPDRPEVSVRDLKACSRAQKLLATVNVKLANGCYTAALQMLEKAISLQPDFPEAYASKGLVLMKLRRPADAEESLQTALQLDPGSRLARKSLGYLFLTTGRPALAVDQLKSVAAQDAAESVVHAWLGEALYQAGRVEEAEAPLKEALTRDPACYRASYRLGYLYLQLRRLPEAVVFFHKFLETNRDLNPSAVMEILKNLEQK